MCRDGVVEWQGRAMRRVLLSLMPRFPVFCCLLSCLHNPSPLLPFSAAFQANPGLETTTYTPTPPGKRPRRGVHFRAGGPLSSLFVLFVLYLSSFFVSLPFFPLCCIFLLLLLTLCAAFPRSYPSLLESSACARTKSFTTHPPLDCLVLFLSRVDFSIYLLISNNSHVSISVVLVPIKERARPYPRISASLVLFGHLSSHQGACKLPKS
jgi:hypothetical protein